ncbi:hypothetical protein LOAG_14532 [Loa loa]|uniref:Uncharacterized protein n=1 Tax=Loa loa TaxID=7209 RepID=A0A1S0THQ4_LOALO|nr:hypothetical protein LOAG_14532 [Loa loa]EFO13995.2 hypothetical protein LOAG_14532 [Loa loa]
MDSHYSCRQRRFRPHSPIPQESNPIYRSSELDYSISGTGAGGGGGYYFGASGPGHFGSEKQPRRSRSLENRRDWLFTDDYGFPVMGTDERFNGASKRYQCQQQRNYHYQPYLSINTGPATGYRGTYDGRRGNEHYFDNFVTLQSNPTESDWDALDRSIRNYRENPNGEQMAVTVRRSKAQSLSPVRPSHGGIGGTLGGTKSRRHNLPSYFYRHSGTVGGFAGSQSGIAVNRNESVRRTRNDFPSGSALQDEVEFGADRGIVNYYRAINSSHQQPDYYGPGVGPANVTSAMRDRAIIRGTTADTTRYGFGAQKYYKFHCCCLSFRWPPWAFEEVEPPQPIYRRT